MAAGSLGAVPRTTHPRTHAHTHTRTRTCTRAHACTHTHALFQNNPPGTSDLLPLVECLLEVAAFPDDAIASMSLNFWSKLAHELTSQFSPQPMDGEHLASPSLTAFSSGRMGCYMA